MVDVDPDYLMSLYKDLTTIHGETLTRPYIGKWIKVSGPVGDIHSDSLSFAGRTSRTANGIHMLFGKHATDLPLLRPGQTVTVLGCVYRIGRFDMTLTDCEIVR